MALNREYVRGHELRAIMINAGRHAALGWQHLAGKPCLSER